MGAACPQRKQVSSETQERTGKIPCAAKLSSTKEQVAKMGCSAPAPLPTKSWRALLEDASLSADAKPFTPPPGLADLHYPQKQDVAKDPQIKHVASNHNGPGHAQVAAVPTTLGLASGGSTAISTQTYLQLLKEGGTKKKPPSAARGKETRPHAAKQTAVTALANRFYSSGQSKPPMTVSGLKQQNALSVQEGITSGPGKFWTWQNALSMQIYGEQGEEASKNKVAHDDIEAEKMNAAPDLSDPAYWSETECGGKKVLCSNASAHRLGRRQPLSAKVCSYVMQDLSYDLDRAVGKLLSRLSLLGEQQRAIQPEITGRRLVIGLKEVARRVKQSKVSCLVMAPDLDSDTTEGGLDDRVREVIAMCYERNIPVIFALSRVGLGQALGKSMVVSLLGVLDVTGAKELFNDTVHRARNARQTWLARLPDKQ